MNTVLHKAATRGHAHHGRLDTWHTFSFGTYHDPSRMHFGALRVLNDDTVMGGGGFGRHPHDNMEIISIVLDGELEHTDSLGNVQKMGKGDVQVMSAGTGVVHAEKNGSAQLPVRFLQIWILPDKRNVAPRYEQQHFSTADLHNKLVPIASPMEEAGGVHLHQRAWLCMGNLEKGKKLVYDFKEKTNGVYAFLLEGDVTINDIVLNRRDGLGIDGCAQLNIAANLDSKLLLIEVPV